MSSQLFTISVEQEGLTLAAVVRANLAGHSWSQVRRLIETRRVRVGGEICLDPARRVRAGDEVELSLRSAPKPRRQEIINIRHLDAHVVVVEKPAGLSTVRHPVERDWPQRRKALSPTLEDIVRKLI